MKKQTISKFKNEFYLLGKDLDDQKVWLEKASYDCGWYWGIGYIKIFNKNYTDINYHGHFDSLFLEKNIYDSFINYFSEISLSKNEIWQLLELMQSLYILRKYSDLLYCGGAHITNPICADIIKNDEEYKKINGVVIPELNNKIYELLSN